MCARPIVALLLVLPALALWGCQPVGGQDKVLREKPVLPEVDTKRRVVRIPATLRLKAFRKGRPAHHHLIAWSGGGAGKKALLRTPVSDVHVLDALEKLGGKPGDNLKPEAWTSRADPDHSAPDVRARGTSLRVWVVLPDGSKKPVSALLEDLHKHGFEWRLAGNRKLIPIWKSGCVVCLQSCPGSKVANTKATMRDLHHGRSAFRPSKLAIGLGEKTALIVEIEIVEPKKIDPLKRDR